MTKQPHKCPVCEGRGLVIAGFYSAYGPMPVSSNAEPPQEECRTCKGTGIVWEPISSPCYGTPSVRVELVDHLVFSSTRTGGK